MYVTGMAIPRAAARPVGSGAMVGQTESAGHMLSFAAKATARFARMHLGNGEQQTFNKIRQRYRDGPGYILKAYRHAQNNPWAAQPD